MANYEGTAGNDVHRGTADGEWLEGKDGNDELHGLGGHDMLWGDEGDDQLFGGANIDHLDGGLGDDLLVGGSGNDVLRGRGGVDHYHGGDDDGRDQIYGTTGDRAVFFMVDAVQGVFADLRTGVAIDGHGNRETMTGIESLSGGSAFADEMRGSGVSNYLGGGAGDTLMGFGGNDYFSLDAAAALLDGGAGIDTLGAFGTQKYVPDNDGDGWADLVEAYQGVTVDLARNLVIDAFGDTGAIRGVENFAGSLNYYDDRLIGDDNDNIIRGLGGGDHIDGRGGRDTVDYSELGNYGLHAVIVDLAAGYSEDVQLYDIPGEPAGPRYGRDTVLGIENVIGTGRGDRLLGDDNANVISPDAGNDIGNGRGGVDTVDYSDVRSALTVDLSANLAIQAGTGAGPVYWGGGWNGPVVEADDAERTRDRLYNIENVVGSGHDDRITGDGAANRLAGGRGNDVIAYSGGGDTFVGGAGYDTVDYSGAGGVVTLDLAAGAASVAGSPDPDRLFSIENAIGSGFEDRLAGNARQNRLDGREGADHMAGGEGNDLYTVDHLADRVVEARDAGADRVRSSVDFALKGNVENLALTGAQYIDGTGNGLANIIRGNDGGNILDGHSGNDLLDGGAGDDGLHGGRGRDRLDGGTGSDSFFFDTLLRANEADTILDFSAADDSIRLDRAIFQGVEADGRLPNHAFRAGTTAEDASDRILYDEATGDIFYDADGDGGAAAVLFAQVTPGTELTAADFFVYG
ncbi:hypothetical protein ACFQRC_05355 [Enterovirga sp. GCM10030262]|uniref:calcium-binding protein n=1 Tax=Enterovirga sp. GCM10030262 TaxID=3273391 RepID=UPI00360AD935